jgi:hypothetical protein
MKYTVKYKTGWFWKSIRNVVADGYIDDRNIRFFVLEDKTMIEISAEKVMFKFPPERDELVKKASRNEKTA